MNMADKTSLTSMFCALCLLVFINGFRVDCTDISSSFGTCDTEESEDDFCESGDRNLYLTNIKVSTEDSQKAKPERVVASKIYSEAIATEEISKGEINDSLSEHRDKQTQDTDNSTNDWLGLQIPLVDGVRVGHIQEIEVLPGIKRQMKTLSMRPLVFEIPDFLDADECELIIALAENKNLKDNPKGTDSQGIQYEDPLNTFRRWDFNCDQYIDPEEIVLIPGKMDLKFTRDNATEMIKFMDLDKDDNGKIDITEFKTMELEKIKEYIAAQLNDSSLRRIPKSKISWLWHDEDELLRYQPDLLYGFHQRLQSITKIPKEIIEESEPMQVLQFEEDNYQYCQQDSEPSFKGVPCCLYGDMKECRICRFITVSYFLNDVDGGGDIVFPLANNNFENDVMNNSGNWSGFFTYDKTTGSKSQFKVNINFKMDGANKALYGKGSDVGGAFELIDSLVTDNIVRFRKRYLNKGNGQQLPIKYAGRLKGNAQIEGKWWIPGQKKMHGFFFMRYEAYEKWMNTAISRCNSYEYCSKGNLVIKPERGKAILWYNHLINNEGTWIGGLDNTMYYGHCDVTKGEKWMATNWINIDGDGDSELRAWKKGNNLITHTKTRVSQNILELMQRKRESINTDVIEDELKKEMADEEEWTFEENRPKERHVLNAVASLLETLKDHELRSVSKVVHQKLEMLCVPLVLNQGGKISLVDGSKAE